MPVVGRLDWVLRQAQMGRLVRISFGRALDPSKAKVRIMLPAASSVVIPPATLMVATALLRSLRDLAVSPNCSCMDRGHRHHDGTSEISIWLQPKVDVQSSPKTRTRRLTRSSLLQASLPATAPPPFAAVPEEVAPRSDAATAGSDTRCPAAARLLAPLHPQGPPLEAAVTLQRGELQPPGKKT